MYEILENVPSTIKINHFLTNAMLILCIDMRKPITNTWKALPVIEPRIAYTLLCYVE